MGGEGKRSLNSDIPQFRAFKLKARFETARIQEWTNLLKDSVSKFAATRRFAYAVWPAPQRLRPATAHLGYRRIAWTRLN